MPRPHTPILDPDTIARAALDALDSDGSFTMPGIAKRLNVAVSSLYHHVASREQLLELIRGVIAEELSVAIVWPEDWREVAVSYTHLTLPTIALLCRSRWSPYH